MLKKGFFFWRGRVGYELEGLNISHFLYLKKPGNPAKEIIINFTISLTRNLC